MVKITNDHLKLTDNLNQYSKVPFTGTVILWTGSTSPDGALLCNGNQYEVEDYPALAEFLGYPSTDTYFNVPNFNNRIPIGADNTITATNNGVHTGGEKKIGSIEHNHIVDLHGVLQTHYHWNKAELGNADWNYDFSVSNTTKTIAANTTHPQVNYYPPYTVVNYIIYT
tara:strand:- start:2164 stop:2670 length:507 start_codon:yes stop_codon:yes gene_type:complete